MDRCVKISEARARLFDLVDQVTEAREGVVLIEHRDRAERTALISERYLRYLQSTIAELRKSRGPAFRLAGSARLVARPDEVETALAGH
jgi:PHD/YefM family antitoxin component YafN of YafNO toxin-antitoxin module